MTLDQDELKEIIEVLNELRKHRDWFSEGPYGPSPDISVEFRDRLVRLQTKLINDINQNSEPQVTCKAPSSSQSQERD